jgi:hypothetical protein
MSFAQVIGAGFLLGQLAWMLYEQTRPTRYFCWAPNDYVTDYQLAVTVAGRALSDEEVLRRYHWPRQGRFENVPQHLIDIVRQFEHTYGRAEEAHVQLVYRLNDHAEQEWRWPST